MRQTVITRHSLHNFFFVFFFFFFVTKMIIPSDHSWFRSRHLLGWNGNDFRCRLWRQDFSLSYSKNSMETKKFVWNFLSKPSIGNTNAHSKNDLLKIKKQYFYGPWFLRDICVSVLLFINFFLMTCPI